MRTKCSEPPGAKGEGLDPVLDRITSLSPSPTPIPSNRLQTVPRR